MPPIDQGISWTLPPLHDLRLMRAVYVQHAFKPHVHDYYVLGIIERGVQSFTHERAFHVTTPGQLIVINPWEVHTGEAVAADGFQYRALYPTTALMQTIAANFDTGALPRFGGSVKHDPQLFRWIQRLHARSETADDTLALEEDLTAFFVALVRRHAVGRLHLPNVDTSERVIEHVRDFLEAHYSSHITLDRLAREVSLSPFHLARLFRRRVGIPPHKYLESVRIRHAERLLAAGAPIADVAYRTGFSSQSHLNRTFKRTIGTTPGLYVQQRKIV